LNGRGIYGTVPGMSPPQAARAPLRTRRQHARDVRRARRIAVLVALGAILATTLLLSAFGGGDPPTVATTAPANASRLLPAQPSPTVVALLGSLRLELPVAQSHVTAIGYHAGSPGALALKPVGTQANQGLLTRLVHRIVGGDSRGPRWYQLSGGEGPATGALDVGAAPGTDVYSPVDGLVVGLNDLVLNGRAYGSRIEIQPSGAPSIVVSITHLRPDPSLTVGSTVTAVTSKIGTLIDFSAAERQALARYTQDAGNHVSLEVHPAATLALP